ncbi:uncharacterized protein METZ01_LOCUS295613, partial [marine metagenome]
CFFSGRASTKDTMKKLKNIRVKIAMIIFRQVRENQEKVIIRLGKSFFKIIIQLME